MKATVELREKLVTDTLKSNGIVFNKINTGTFRFINRKGQEITYYAKSSKYTVNREHKFFVANFLIDLL